ncbi:MAG: DNA polymerase III subunit gamma/tau [Bacteroidaceae bacterium]|nr:DNA polymerase III subunit gamma/tau [Bacteroidaceae bacterium]
MSNYIVSARKYRPVTFDTVVGQQSLTTTLKNAIETGKLAHAYLFCGPRGVGKTTCARIFAKTINCEHRNANGEACDECESCRAFNEQRSLNIHELDAASNNSVDDMRQLIEQVQVPPQIGRYKVFIIDEVHMLSTAAFNAFLKTLEEPPSHAIFILATTEKHKILPTILSRCQTYDFNRMDISLIVGHLKGVAEKEGIQYEEEALNMIAQKADGGMRDALSIFDQVASFTNGNITYQKVIEDLNVLDYDYYFRLTEQFLAVDVTGCMLTLNDVLSRGFQANHFMAGLASHFRNLLMAHDPQTLHLLEASDQVRQRYAEQARKCSPRMLYQALRLCNQCDLNYRQSNNKRLLVEITLIQVAQLSDPTPDDAPGSGLGPNKRLKPIFKALMPVSTSAQPALQSTPASTAAPATAPTVAPAPAPKATLTSTPAATPSTPQPAAKPIGRPGVARTISITRRPAQTAPAEQPKAASLEAIPEEALHTATNIGDLPFTAEHFNYQWMRFAMQLPIEQMANAERMKMMRPKVTEGSPVVEVTVENPRVCQYMNALRPQLLQYLRRELSNSQIDVQFSVDESELPQRLFAPHEILADMRKRKNVEVLLESLPLVLG